MTTPLRIGFCGLRHGHILGLLEKVRTRDDLTLVGIWEAAPDRSLLADQNLKCSHDSLEDLCADSDIIALGDCYGHRGGQALDALRAGCHLIADKPLCTRESELKAIQELATRNDRKIGMMLDLRDHPNWIALREQLRAGVIGAVHTIGISAQHPLLLGTRPEWYFEPGLHGGTLNDIAIHAVDFVPWLTGLKIERIDFARCWNAKATVTPHFKDCAQAVLRLENGASVMLDASYLAPEKCGYTLDTYWRTIVHGDQGQIETTYGGQGLRRITDADAAPVELPPAAARPGGYLDDFLADCAGHPNPDGLHTEGILQASALALRLQFTAEGRPQPG